MDQELTAFLEGYFQKQEETALRTLAVIEALRDEAHLLGEAVVRMDERLERCWSDIQKLSNQDQGWVPRLLDRLTFQYGELSYRHTQLDLRVRFLESPRERRYQEALDKVREIVNRPRREAQPASE